ncbi:MAG TPA: efflux RND transporter periplasmic adaptor subunit [Anaeromyxobacteraceae bacterium]|nr:efflux RND transporter periplasmic adaptor subunit [Anaeromyxobacteraceae bacterium]
MLGSMALAGCGDAKAAAPQHGAPAGPVTVTGVTARQGTIAVHLSEIGTVTPVYTSTITSQVTGVISAVRYGEGQPVKAGDPLIDLDDRPYQAQLAQARGTLVKDRHALAQAEMDLARYREAWARNAIPKQQLEDQEQLVRQTQGTVQSDQGAVRYAEVQIVYCHIVAPVTGRVGLRLVDPGNLVVANGTTPLVVVTQLDPITVIFAIAEDEIGEVRDQLRQGRTLRVDAFDRTGQHLIASGHLIAVDNQIDSTTGTVRLRALFDNSNDRLFPNQFVTARLEVRTISGATLIPTSAIQHNGDAAFVYVIENATAELRTVKPGVSDQGLTAVEGVRPGEVVANSSFEKLRANAKVTLAVTGAAPSQDDGGTP